MVISSSAKDATRVAAHIRPVNANRTATLIRKQMAPSPRREAGIESRIVVMRDTRVILDASLADLYDVSTKALLQAVKRNLRRFPPDFMFQLTDQEVANLRSQTVTSSLLPSRWGGRRWGVYAFTEQGVAMLSSVLRSARAIAVNIAIMRAFVRLREIVAANAELARKLDEPEQRVSGHDVAITTIVQTIRELAAPPSTGPARKIGFV